jgi:uncharacterized protein (DUF1501 family)
MNRRDLLRMSVTAGGMLLCGGVRMALAQQAYSGPYWLFVEADGGWDPTSFCDPKGAGLGPDGQINTYDQGDIRQIGNIRYAPPPDAFANDTSLYSNRAFFEAHYQRLLVINGINYGTNSHLVGRTVSWTGRAAPGYPALPALIAAETASDMSIPFLTNSSNESSATDELIPKTRVRREDAAAIREIARPYRRDLSQAAEYHSSSMRALIDEASAERRSRQLANERLLRVQQALAGHNSARNRDARALEDFASLLGSVAAPNAYVASHPSARRLFDQAQTAFAAFEAGAAATAQINLGGFDTHTDHDNQHYPQLMDFLAAVDNIIDDAQSRGIAGRLIIVMASDFGRTNRYNTDDGKDHWPHSSVMAWAAPAWFAGNRVVGATDNLQVSRRVNRNTLALDASGIELTPEHVHQSLRQLAGIAQNPLVTSNYPFAGPILPLFA